MNYLEAFNKSNLSYSDIAHELGCCELSARKKISGATRITKAEKLVLDNLLKGDNELCTISRHNR